MLLSVPNIVNSLFYRIQITEYEMMNLISILYDIIKLITIIRLIGRLTRMKIIYCCGIMRLYLIRGIVTDRGIPHAKSIVLKMQFRLLLLRRSAPGKCLSEAAIISSRVLDTARFIPTARERRPAASKIRRHNQTVAR